MTYVIYFIRLPRRDVPSGTSLLAMTNYVTLIKFLIETSLSVSDICLNSILITCFGNPNPNLSGHSITTKFSGFAKISSKPKLSTLFCSPNRYKSIWINFLKIEFFKRYSLLKIKVGERMRFLIPNPRANPWTKVVFPLPNSPLRVRIVACFPFPIFY